MVKPYVFERKALTLKKYLFHLISPNKKFNMEKEVFLMKNK